MLHATAAITAMTKGISNISCNFSLIGSRHNVAGLPSEIEQITGPLPTEFHSSPPKFVRGVLYNYAFTTERDSKAWWQRTGVVNEQYIPPIENGVLCISCAFAADCASWK